MSELQQYDYGVVVKGLIKDEDSNIVDISAATSLYFYFKTPSEQILTKSGQLYTDGTDGYMSYTIASGDISEAGIWSIQCHVITPLGSWKTNIPEFIVRPNLV